MLKILFFGFIAEKMGVHELMLKAQSGQTLADVVQEVGCENFKPLLFAVNEQQESDLNTLLHAGDEVAIMPPFSGG